jgi:hypothetical protein
VFSFEVFYASKRAPTKDVEPKLGSRSFLRILMKADAVMSLHIQMEGVPEAWIRKTPTSHNPVQVCRYETTEEIAPTPKRAVCFA